MQFYSRTISHRYHLPSSKPASGYKAFTLVELIVIIVILAIVTAGAIVGYNQYITRAEQAVDTSNLATLNTSTDAYEASAQKGQHLSDLPTDAARMQRLAEVGLLPSANNGILTPILKDAAFLFSPSSTRWLYTLGSVQSYDFSKVALTDFRHLGSWAQTSNGFVSPPNGGLLFIPNPRNEYTIQTVAQLGSGSSSGYGILLNATLSPEPANLDTSLIVQFDRGLNAIVIRNRIQGAESGVLATYTSGNTNNVVHSTSDTTWWAAPHQLTLKVTAPAANLRLLAFSIDGALVFSNYAFTNPVLPAAAYMGFRTWPSSTTTFKSLEISGSTQPAPATDTTNLAALNLATSIYEPTAQTGQHLSNLPTDAARMQRLSSRGLINGNHSGILVPSQPNAAFVYSSASKTWLYTINNTQSYSFASYSPSDFRQVGSWGSNPQGFISPANGGLLFLPNPRVEYTVDSIAQLSPGSSSGYAILLNASLSPSNSDTSLSVQFDRGSDAVVIRKRTNGAESGILATYNSANTGNVVHSTSDTAWWAASHKLTLKVTTATSTTRNLALYIDNAPVFSNYTFTNPVSPSASYVGLRTWPGATTTFTSLTITGPIS